MFFGAGFFGLLFLLIPLNYLLSQKVLKKNKFFINMVLLINLFFTVYCLLFVFYFLWLVGAERDYHIINSFYLNYNLVVILISGVVQVLIMHLIFKFFFNEEYSENLLTFLMLYSAPIILLIVIKVGIDYI